VWRHGTDSGGYGGEPGEAHAQAEIEADEALPD
jgi:hypothetical protein